MADAAARPRTSRPASRRFLVPGLIVLIAAAGAGLAWYLLAAAPDSAPALPPPAEYLALPPPFVVNLDETPVGPRYLQVEVELVTRTPSAAGHLQHHAPALRARLLTLFSQQTHGGLATVDGREALRVQALEAVRALMIAETGQPQADDLLFTSFVTQ